MKLKLFIFVLGFFTFPLVADLYAITGKFNSFFMVPNYGISDVLLGNCQNKMGENGHGWKFNIREYNGCNKIQIIISDLLYSPES